MREREGNAAEMSYAMMPERVVLESANVSALASMSRILSAICRCLRQVWWLDTVLLATLDAGMSRSVEVILLSVLESDIGLVFLGCLL